MSNPITRRPMTNWLPMTTNPDLMQLLHKIGLVTLAGELEDFLARATKGRWSPRQILEELARREHEERAQRSLKRRLAWPRSAASSRWMTLTGTGRPGSTGKSLSAPLPWTLSRKAATSSYWVPTALEKP